MKQIVIIPDRKEKSAYRQAREQGQSPFEFVKMTLVIMAALCALVALSSKFDKLMHDPLWGMLGTGIIIIVAIKLFQGFDKNYG